MPLDDLLADDAVARAKERLQMLAQSPQPTGGGLERLLSILPMLAGGANPGNPGMTSPGGVGGFPEAGGSPSKWESVAKRMAAQEGWKGREWKALDSIIERESGWNPRAANPTSSARGIPQTMMSVHFGQDWQSDPRAQRFLSQPRRQIDWLLDYVRGRYGDPLAALQFKNEHGWY